MDITGNFILENLAKREGFPQTKKKNLYNLVIIDRNLLLNGDRKISKGIILLYVKIY